MSSHLLSHTIRSPHFRGEVVKKIYRVWLFRRFLPVLLAEIVVVALFLSELGRAVFFQRIVENSLRVFFNDPAAIFAFVFGAFRHTTVFIKVLTLGVIIVLALLLRHLTQGLLRWILVRENFFAKIKNDRD